MCWTKQLKLYTPLYSAIVIRSSPAINHDSHPGSVWRLRRILRAISGGTPWLIAHVFGWTPLSAYTDSQLGDSGRVVLPCSPRASLRTEKIVGKVENCQAISTYVPWLRLRPSLPALCARCVA